MKVLLALTLFLVSNLTNGKPLLENNEVNIPQIKKLNFRLEEIASEKSLNEITNIVTSLDQHNPQANGLFDVDINALLDELLTNLTGIIIRSGLDPMALDDTTLDLIPTGTIKLTSGWLQDISSMKRYDDVVVSYHAGTKTVTFLLPISFKALLFTYKYLTKVLLLSIDGDVQGKIDDVKLNLEINYDPNNQTISMGKLSMKDSGKITVKFTGNGLVDWLTNAMTSVITTVLDPILIKIVEGFVTSAGNDLIDAINDYIHGLFVV